MFFGGWFWAFFDFSLFPAHIVYDSVTRTVSVAADVAAQWPPKGLEVIDAFRFPLLNTLILLTSGTTITWA
ncbi:cytochrome c oxidase subunit 3, partial [Salmonella enterica]|uniref:cytochrome c oxidase subunit 3 n=1 Tax=Salmonella enterica TaxID=28901 RepID=UPI003CEC565F